MLNIFSWDLGQVGFYSMLLPLTTLSLTMGDAIWHILASIFQPALRRLGIGIYRGESNWIVRFGFLAPVWMTLAQLWYLWNYAGFVGLSSAWPLLLYSLLTGVITIYPGVLVKILKQVYRWLAPHAKKHPGWATAIAVPIGAIAFYMWAPWSARQAVRDVASGASTKVITAASDGVQENAKALGERAIEGADTFWDWIFGVEE